MSKRRAKTHESEQIHGAWERLSSCEGAAEFDALFKRSRCLCTSRLVLGEMPNGLMTENLIPDAKTKVTPSSSCYRLFALERPVERPQCNDLEKG